MSQAGMVLPYTCRTSSAVSVQYFGVQCKCSLFLSHQSSQIFVLKWSAMISILSIMSLSTGLNGEILEWHTVDYSNPNSPQHILYTVQSTHTSMSTSCGIFLHRTLLPGQASVKTTVILSLSFFSSLPRTHIDTRQYVLVVSYQTTFISAFHNIHSHCQTYTSDIPVVFLGGIY